MNTKELFDEEVKKCGDEGMEPKERRVAYAYFLRGWHLKGLGAARSGIAAGIKHAADSIRHSRTMTNFGHIPTVVRALEWLEADILALQPGKVEYDMENCALRETIHELSAENQQLRATVGALEHIRLGMLEAYNQLLAERDEARQKLKGNSVSHTGKLRRLRKHVIIPFFKFAKTAGDRVWWVMNSDGRRITIPFGTSITEDNNPSGITIYKFYCGPLVLGLSVGPKGE